MNGLVLFTAVTAASAALMQQRTDQRRRQQSCRDRKREAEEEATRKAQEKWMENDIKVTRRKQQRTRDGREFPPPLDKYVGFFAEDLHARHEPFLVENTISALIFYLNPDVDDVSSFGPKG
jgi:hypothetical protein